MDPKRMRAANYEDHRVWGALELNYTWDTLDSACKSLENFLTVGALEARALEARNDSTTAATVGSSRKKRKREGGEAEQRCELEEKEDDSELDGEREEEDDSELDDEKEEDDGNELDDEKEEDDDNELHDEKEEDDDNKLDDEKEEDDDSELDDEKEKKDEELRQAKEDLLKTWRRYSLELFKEDVKILRDFLPAAEQEVRLSEQYFSKSGFVKHDSKLDVVMEEIPLATEFPLVDRETVAYMIKRMILWEKKWDMIFWKARFTESLPNRQCLQGKLPDWPKLRLLRGEDDYRDLMSHVVEGSHVTERHLLEHEIKHYSWFLKDHRSLGTEEAKARFVSHARYILEDRKKIYEEEKEVIRNPFNGPLNFLAKQVLQGYKITDDLLELLKIRTYFGRF